MMVKSVVGHKEETCFDNPYFLPDQINYKDHVLEHVTDTHFFRKNFLGSEHITFLGTLEKYGPIIISLKKEENPNDGKEGDVYTAIVRTKDHTERRETLYANNLKKSFLGRKPSSKQILQLLDRDANFSKLKAIPAEIHLEARLLALDEFKYRPKYKVGVILAKPGQTTDNEYFSNSIILFI
jgi:hypothetical protein